MKPSVAPERADYAVLFLLPFGAIVLPFFGWFIGVIWLWQSSVWSRRQKLVGTFVVPGGCAAPLYVNWLISGVAHPGGSAGLTEGLVFLGLGIAFVAPLVTASWLASIMRRNRRATHDVDGISAI